MQSGPSPAAADGTPAAPATVPAAPRRATLAALALVFIFFYALPRLWLASVKELDRDEFQYLNGARFVAAGEVPYRDFYDNHHPFFFFLLAPVFAICGETWTAVTVARFLMLGFSLATFVTLVRAVRKGLGLGAATIAAILLGGNAIFFEKTLEIRADTVSSFLVTLAFVWMVAPDRPRPFSAGLAAGLALAFTPKALFPIAGITASFLLLLRRPPLAPVETRLPSSGRAVTEYLIGSLIAPVGLLAYLLTRGTLGGFLECQAWNAAIPDYVKFRLIRTYLAGGLGNEVTTLVPWNALPTFGFCLAAIYAGAGAPGLNSTPRSMLARIIGAAIVVQSLAVLGVSIFRSQERLAQVQVFFPILAGLLLPARRPAMFFFRSAFLGAAATLAGAFFLPMAHGQYYANGIPLLSACLAGFLAAAFRDFQKWEDRAEEGSFWVHLRKRGFFRTSSPVSPYLGFLFLLLFSASFLLKAMVLHWNSTGDGQRSVLEYVRSSTRPGDRVFDFFSGLTLGRPHGSKFLFLNYDLARAIEPEFLRKTLMEGITDPRTKVVIADENFRDEVARALRARPTIPPEFYEYVQANFRADPVRLPYRLLILRRVEKR